jgi:LAGLIDADG DNA endonuclease family protein
VVYFFECKHLLEKDIVHFKWVTYTYSKIILFKVFTNVLLFPRWIGEKYGAEYKNNQSLTPFQSEALIGLILGDLFVGRPSLNTFFRFEQSIINIAYLNHLYSIFMNFVATPPYSPKRNPHKITGEKHESVVFKTLTFTIFNFFHELFYKKVDSKWVKSVPENIGNYFTEVSLAFWIMDDEYYANGALILCTDSFSYSDILILINMLKTKFNIDCKPQKIGEDKWRIRFTRAETNKVRILVKEYFIYENYL